MYGVHAVFGRGTLFVRCREVVHSSECPLSEVPLYISVSENRTCMW